MKKLLLFLIPFLVGAGGLVAAVKAPRADNGTQLQTLDWVGADVCVIDASKATNSVICASGPVIVYGVLANGVALNQYAIFFDTNVSVGGGVYSSVLSTKTIVYCSSTTAISSGGTSQSFNLKFPAPLKFTDGLAVAPGTTQTGSNAWVIMYRKRTATE